MSIDPWSIEQRNLIFEGDQWCKHFVMVCVFQPMYITSISENVPIGSYVIKVAATDADEEGTRNAYIEYRIDGEGASTFAMHRKTGKQFFCHPVLY